jgi:hypothetical protein
MPTATDQRIARLNARKQQGFVTQLTASGKSAAQVKALLPKYVSQDTRRQKKLEGLRAAILG